MTLSLVLFGFASLANIFLIVILPHSAVGSALSMALITASMHGINLMLISYSPSRFLATGYVSTISGILNACAYLGRALSAYGIAWISEKLGWYGMILTWLAACVLGLCSAATIGMYSIRSGYKMRLVIPSGYRVFVGISFFEPV